MEKHMEKVGGSDGSCCALQAGDEEASQQAAGIRQRKHRIQKSMHACIVEGRESTRKRLEGTLPTDHEDRIAGKGFNSLSHHNLVHIFIPTP